jgi:hypothetical protein
MAVQAAVPYSDDPKTDSHETPAALEFALPLLCWDGSHLLDANQCVLAVCALLRTHYEKLRDIRVWTQNRLTSNVS